MSLSVDNFFHFYIFNYDAVELTKEDRLYAKIASIALGVLTLGTTHLFCALVLYDRSYKIGGDISSDNDIHSFATRIITSSEGREPQPEPSTAAVGDSSLGGTNPPPEDPKAGLRDSGALPSNFESSFPTEIPDGNSGSDSSQKRTNSGVSSGESKEELTKQSGLGSVELELESTKDIDSTIYRSGVSIPSGTVESFIEELEEWAKLGTSGETREVAKKRILDAYTSNSSSLDLSCLRLKSLPENIGELIALQELNLSNNELTQLPDSIGSLTALQKLYLSWNPLTQLSDNIGDLTALQELGLEGNQLTQLPNSLGNLTALQKLVLSGSRVTQLPDSIGGLTALQELNLMGNQLTQLPNSIGDLTALQELALAWNKLTQLPDRIGDLTALQKLVLAWNQLTQLPNSIGDLTALQELDLAINQLTQLPDRIGDLTALQELDLVGNQLTQLPNNIGNCTSLIRANFKRNPLQSLPHNLLSLSHNCNIEISAENFSEQVMRNLREITQAEGYNGPRIQFSMESRVSNEDSRSLEELLQSYFEIAELPDKDLKFIANLKNVEQGSLKSWLSRLWTIKTLRRERESEKAFAKKVLSYLERADKDENFLGVFKGVIYDASKKCGDRMALSLIHIDLQYKLAYIPLDDPKSAERLLVHGVKTMGILEEIAREKVKTLPLVDEIEVYLAYPVKLRKKLDLPIEVEEMIYYEYSGVKEEDLENAAEKVQSFYDNKQERLEFLVQQDKWIEVLKHHDNDRYKRIKEEGVERVDEDPGYYQRELITFSRDILQIK